MNKILLYHILFALFRCAQNAENSKSFEDDTSENITLENCKDIFYSKPTTWTPFLATLRYMNNLDYYEFYFGAGALIANDVVLTTANGINEHYYMSVVFGVREGHSQRFRVREVVMHPEYNKKTGENDIAMVYLWDTISGDGTYAKQPIQMNCMSNLKKGTKCRVWFWTHLYPDHKIYEEYDIKAVDVEILDKSRCNLKISDSRLCTEYPEHYKNGFNFGSNVGGPLVCGDTLVGIMSAESYNSGHDTLRNYVIYEDVSKHRAWIKRQMRSNFPPLEKYHLLLLCILTTLKIWH